MAKSSRISPNAVDAGALQPLLDEKRFAFTEIAQARNRLTSGAAVGKIVVDVQ